MVYTFRLSIGFCNADRSESFNVEDWGWDEDEWDALSDLERESFLEKELQEWANQFIDYSYE